jgi:hypothetical protein
MKNIHKNSMNYLFYFQVVTQEVKIKDEHLSVPSIAQFKNDKNVKVKILKTTKYNFS